MQILISKAKITAVIVIVLLMASITLMAMSVQPVQAQTPAELNIPHGGSPPRGAPGMPNLGPLPTGVTPQYTIAQTAYMSITPNPIGVGQQVLVNVWTSPGMYHAFYGQGYSVQIQKPDGTTVTVGPFDSYLGDDTAWFQYVVDQVGTWKFKFSTQGTYLPVGNYTDRPELTSTFGMAPGNVYFLGASVWYTPCNTDWQEITVQQEMVASWPPSPLPTDYWTRPISPENREWWPIAGNYPWRGAIYYPGGRVLYSSNYKYTAYVQAPNTAHVVWRRQGAIAGLIGGDAYQYSISSGGGNPTIIYAGRCYQTITKVMPVLINGTYYNQPTTVWQCYDLRTGQVYWEQTGVSPIPTAISYEIGTVGEVPGAEAALGYTVYLVSVGSRLVKYSVFTGAVSLNISLPSYITSGTIYDVPWVYSVQTINATAGQYRLINWTMYGSDTNFTTRIGTNITFPLSSVPGIRDDNAGVGVTCSWNTPPGPQWCIGYMMTSVNMRTGAVLFNQSTNDTLTQNVQSGSSCVCDRGKIAFGAQNRHWVCFDAFTGKQLWISDLTAYPWGNWWPYNTASYDFNESKGAIITPSYAGIYAIDWDTGHILWHYASPMVPFEDPYGTEPFFTGVTMADGKVYAYGGEHTPSQPVTRGWHLHCINATTGEGIWKMTGPATPGPIADGYITASDPYDGCMYVYGKGQSGTTVSASPAVITIGSAVLIKGTVMDMSPGDQGSTTNPTARLDSPTKPGTVPCVSAASMETQMEYLYMQHPIDGIWHNETITGVPVILTAIGSDGTVIDLGSVTTNGYYGTFSYAWTPPKAGTYTITATFAGDDSYGSSTAATSASVSPAPAATLTPTPPAAQPTPDYTAIFAVIIVAVIVAIIIGIANLLALRRRQ
jgi:hypothetical protein